MKIRTLICAILLFTPAPLWAVTEEEAEAMRAEISRLKARVAAMEGLAARLEAMEQKVAAMPEPRTLERIEWRLDGLAPLDRLELVEAELAVTPLYVPETERGKVVQADREEHEAQESEVLFDAGGAVWVNYAYQEWRSPDEGKEDNLNFDNLRLSLDGSYQPEGWDGHYYFSAQHRFYSFTDATHHALIGYQFEEDHKMEIGITQVPFGLLPFASHSFWFGMGYYLGQEDDYDAGFKYQQAVGNWNFHAAWFLNEEYGDAANLGRYSVDLARVDEQQNEERDQFNLRGAYTFEHMNGSTELGLSGEYGAIDNRTTEKSGDRWALAAHFNGVYGRWNPQLQATRYEYNPENPEGVDDRLVRMGNLESFRDVAAEGTVISANLAYRIPLNWGQFTSANCYNDYSVLLKEESAFEDSEINVTGCVFEGGPLWIWADIINGKNAWYLDDSSSFSGLGAGSEDGDWKTRFNVNVEWYF